MNEINGRKAAETDRSRGCLVIGNNFIYMNKEELYIVGARAWRARLQLGTFPLYE